MWKPIQKYNYPPWWATMSEYVLPERSTRGVRTTKLTDEALEADQNFWNQEFFQEKESDESFTLSGTSTHSVPNMFVPTRWIIVWQYFNRFWHWLAWRGGGTSAHRWAKRGEGMDLSPQFPPVSDAYVSTCRRRSKELCIWIHPRTRVRSWRERSRDCRRRRSYWSDWKRRRRAIPVYHSVIDDGVESSKKDGESKGTSKRAKKSESHEPVTPEPEKPKPAVEPVKEPITRVLRASTIRQTVLLDQALYDEEEVFGEHSSHRL